MLQIDLGKMLIAFIAANIGIVVFNVVGMCIMTSQLDDFFANKRNDIYSPPSLKVYLVMWLTIFAVTRLLII